MKRKVSLRDSYLKRLKAEGTHYLWKRNGTIRRQKPLKKLSRSHRHKLSQYYAVRDEFLRREENQVCEICTRRREAGENIPLQAATEVHHRSGRGKMLCEVREFVASCYSCRLWPHENPKQARELGLLT